VSAARGARPALAAKAPPTGRDLGEAVADAERDLGHMVEAYLAWAVADLERLDAACRARAPAREELYRLAHDMKGQGGTVGYPLISAIGASLCRFLEGRPTLDRAALAVARRHVDALRTVIASRLSGDGGARGAELIQRLASSVAEAARYG
jgi:HPt (histidine-containing phosphotransfer) domain-containing protein